MEGQESENLDENPFTIAADEGDNFQTEPGNSAENEEAADADTELDEQNNTTITTEM